MNLLTQTIDRQGSFVYSCELGKAQYIQQVMWSQFVWK